jgi:LAS superfamily LD-carboxypeptidase LdcB
MPETQEEAVQPARTAEDTTSLNQGVAEAQKVVRQQDQRLLESVNGARALNLRQAWTPTNVPEQTVLGYENGSARQVRVVVVDGHLIEKFTGYDFLLMRRAATKAGVALTIVSAYRTYAEQERIYNQRYTNGQLNAVGKIKGPAALPGHSNHQMGKAIDIKVDLTVADLAAGATTPTYLWLKANASLYGFVNSVPKEPWHWSHSEARVVGSAEDEETYRTLVDAGVISPLALDNGRANLSVYVGRDLYDRTSAWNQSLQMSTSSRSAIFAAQGEHAVARASSTANYLAQLQQADAVANRARPSFDTSSLNPLEYDFDTGTWGDLEVV